MAQQRDFDAGELNRALIGTRFAGKLRHFSSVASTNTLLLAAAADGAPDGTVYVADEQTAGRGRGGHTWHSALGDGLYVSALVHVHLPLREALWISLAAGLAAQTAVLQITGLAADIRWPNDLLTGSRKLGGILVETTLDADALRYAVIGIGINVNQSALPADLAAIASSLRLETGQPQSRQRLLAALLRSLDLELLQLEARTTDFVARLAAASTWVRGKHVHVPEAGGYTGITDGLDANGFLRIRTHDGSIRTVLSGGVREI